jgi:hypothetical protein
MSGEQRKQLASDLFVLEALKEQGLTFAECVRSFHDPADVPVIEDARLEWTDDDLEIDNTPITSRGDGGTWVMAWVWMRDSDPDEDEDEEVGKLNGQNDEGNADGTTA